MFFNDHNAINCAIVVFGIFDIVFCWQPPLKASFTGDFLFKYLSQQKSLKEQHGRRRVLSRESSGNHWSLELTLGGTYKSVFYA